jgi:hypothetical protein
VKTNPKTKENRYLPTKINELFGKGLFAGNKIVEICKPRLTYCVVADASPFGNEIEVAFLQKCTGSVFG